MSSAPRISVMICTKDRPDDVKALLDNLSKQTVVPGQVVIVDASAQAALSDFLAAATFPFEWRYLRAAPAVMRQRNLGIENSDGDFIFSLDDDLVLDACFVEQMLKPLQDSPADQVSAVMGRIVDERHWVAGLSLPGRLYYFIRRVIVDIFLLDKVGSGLFRYSGLPTYSRDDGQARLIECISGGCMIFRREVFDNFRFDENMVYAVHDDVDTSKRLLDAGCKVLYQPQAKVWHKKSPGGRIARTDYFRAWVTHYHYIFRKNWPQTPLRRLAFWWSVLGELLLSLMDRDQFKGIVNGIQNVRSTNNPLEAVRNLTRPAQPAAVE